MSATTTEREMFGVPEAAKYLGTTERFVRRLVTQRRITHCRVGKFIKLDSRDLDAFIAAGRVEAVDQ